MSAPEPVKELRLVPIQDCTTNSGFTNFYFREVDYVVKQWDFSQPQISPNVWPLKDIPQHWVVSEHVGPDKSVACNGAGYSTGIASNEFDDQLGRVDYKVDNTQYFTVALHWGSVPNVQLECQPPQNPSWRILVKPPYDVDHGKLGTFLQSFDVCINGARFYTGLHCNNPANDYSSTWNQSCQLPKVPLQ
jgi:hypothetical protein